MRTPLVAGNWKLNNTEDQAITAIYERLGDQEAAAHHYARVIDLWKDCDPELRPLVEAAERALGRYLREVL